jgi:hypothetical protein
LAVLAVAQAATAWAAFLAGKLSATTFSALLSLFVGLLLVAALFPKLTKVKLGGLEAELTSVTYRPEAKAVAGPSAQLQMTTAASVAAAFWFWQ